MVSVKSFKYLISGEKFTKLARAKTINETAFVESEITRLLKKHSMSHKTKAESVYGYKNVLSVFKAAAKRRITYTKENEGIDKVSKSVNGYGTFSLVIFELIKIANRPN